MTTFTRIFLSPLAALLILIPAQEVNAEIVQYVDESGAIHFVDGVERVPEKFRNQLSGSKPLKAISRAGGATYDTPPPKAAPAKQSSRESRPSGRSKGVEVFVTSWCPHCRDLEAYLDANKIRYTRYDIERDDKGKKLYDAIGLQGVPVTRIGSEIFAGFNPTEISNALGRRR